MNDRLHSSCGRRKGGALIIALAAAIPLLIAGGALLTSVTQGRKSTETSVALAQARDVAASGAQDALAQLAVNPNYRGSYQLSLAGPVAQVSVTAWDKDLVDNDGNGMVDDAGEAPFIGIVSSGTTNVAFDKYGLEIDRATRHARSFTEAVVQKVDLIVPINQAAYIDDPLASFKFSGTAFLINGNDTNLDNTPGPQAAVAGIGTPGDPNDIVNQLSKAQEKCVIGKGGAPSVLGVADIDMTAQIAAMTALATMTWNGPDDSYGGDIGDRTNMIPVVAHAKGNLNLNGNTNGCGILIVDGDLTINGSFDYAGFIYVSGAVTFNGGGGNKDLHGALLTLGAVKGTDVRINGTVQIQYSSQALSIVTSQISGGVTLVSWMQR